MPVYEWECRECGRVFEKMYKIKEKPESVECPECQGDSQSIISKTTFHLAGGGWAKDGYE